MFLKSTISNKILSAFSLVMAVIIVAQGISYAAGFRPLDVCGGFSVSGLSITNSKLPATTLKRGDKNDCVKRVQRFFNVIYGEKIEVNGMFDKKLEKLVTNFQKKNGYKPGKGAKYGQVDKQTYGLMLNHCVNFARAHENWAAKRQFCYQVLPVSGVSR